MKYKKKNIQTFLVISAFHGNLNWLKDFLNKVPSIKKIFIYVKESKKFKITKSNKNISFINVKNVGVNMYDINHFLYNNYHKLPERIIFLKSNSFSRKPKHSNMKSVIEICNKNIKNSTLEITHPVKLPISYYENNNRFIEINNNWYSKTKIKRKFFHEFDHFMNFFFKNYTHWKYLKFPPGANFILSREAIHKFPRYLYKEFYKICSHDSWPLEMFFLERSMYSILNSNLKVKSLRKIRIENSPNLKKISYIRKFFWKIYTLTLRFAEYLRPK